MTTTTWTTDLLDALSSSLRYAICALRIEVTATVDGNSLRVSGMTDDHAVGHNGVAKIMVGPKGDRREIVATAAQLDEIAAQVWVK